MGVRLFDPGEFEPGRVKWDNLDDVDPSLPLHEQDSLVGCEDVLAVEYPNDVLLDVSFLARSRPEAFFCVSVMPRGSGGWKPVIERKCHSFGELTAIVRELAPVARDWKK